jgi:hypothetical protein
MTDDITARTERWLADHGLTENDIREVVKAQLLFAAEAITGGASPEHDHIEDDCGDDIRNSMATAKELHSAWHNSGPLETVEVLRTWAEDTTDDDLLSTADPDRGGFDITVLYELGYANGGVSPALEDLIMKIRNHDKGAR